MNNELIERLQKELIPNLSDSQILLVDESIAAWQRTERQRDTALGWIERSLLKGPWINLDSPGKSAAPPHWLRDSARKALDRIRAMEEK